MKMMIIIKNTKMHRHFYLVFFLVALNLSFRLIRGAVEDAVDGGNYLVGVGSYDMTGPAAGVNMMGYPTQDQSTSGIHFRLIARTFIVAETAPAGARFCFVNLDSGISSQLVTMKVLDRLKARYGDMYTEQNLAISSTHTHSGPAGYSQYAAYQIASHGFVQQSCDVIVDAIEKSIIQAHANLKPCTILISKGIVENAGINRNQKAYQSNSEAEKRRYNTDVDKEMTLIKFVDSNTKKAIGAFNWYATDGTSMGQTNRIISGDNKGAAARFFEDWCTASLTVDSSTKISPTQDISSLQQKASTIEATGGQPCDKLTIKNSRVRKYDGSQFVGAFCQSNAGDVSPNVHGAFCTDNGRSCTLDDSVCDERTKCIGQGPGMRDEILSTRIIGERQYKKAVDLFLFAKQQLSGKIDCCHAYVNFTNIEIPLLQGSAKTCPAALGQAYTTGTIDGRRVLDLHQGSSEISNLEREFGGSVKKASQYQVQCQQPKNVLISTGEMFQPYAWAPAVLPVQILRLGKLVILCVPGELTTMAGRRLREAVKQTLINDANGEFDEQTHVVIAGLANAYSQVAATPEEYRHESFEAASTLYGPHTLTAYIHEFKKLARSMASGEKPTPTGITPPDLSSRQVSLVQAPMADSLPADKKFGDICEDMAHPQQNNHFHKNDIVTATFYSANPRNDLLNEGTFAAVEKLNDDQLTWTTVYDDDDFNLFFNWKANESDKNNYGLATVSWVIPENAATGVYRLRHHGASKATADAPVQYFTGACRAFTVSSSRERN